MDTTSVGRNNNIILRVKMVLLIYLFVRFKYILEKL